MGTPNHEDKSPATTAQSQVPAVQTDQACTLYQVPLRRVAPRARATTLTPTALRDPHARHPHPRYVRATLPFTALRAVSVA